MLVLQGRRFVQTDEADMIFDLSQHRAPKNTAEAAKFAEMGAQFRSNLVFAACTGDFNQVSRCICAHTAYD